MEMQGQDKEIGMTGSLVYNRDCSSKVSKTRDQGTTVHGDTIFKLPQTLDQHHPPNHHLLNPQSQPQKNLPYIKPRGSNPDADPDPVPVSVTATSTKEANRSNQRSPAPSTSTAIITVPSIRYRECLKNHAASMGSHVVDGCGEFMPSSEDGTLESLKCAACDCHRNFHRKEIDGESVHSQYAANSLYTYYNNPNRNSTKRNTITHHQQQQPPPFHFYHQHQRISYTSPQTASIAPMMMTFGGGGGSTGGLDESTSKDLNMFHSSAGGQTSVQPKKKKKRFRTKFSQEQKDKMMEFAEKLGWRIQKQDDQEVQDFCTQVGVKRQVFKVWMHNNKQASATKKKQE